MHYIISLLIFIILYYHIKCSEYACCKDTYLTQDWHQRTISIMAHPFTSHEIPVANTALKDYRRITQVFSCCFLNAVCPDWRTPNDVERFAGGQQVCTGFHFFTKIKLYVRNLILLFAYWIKHKDFRLAFISCATSINWALLCAKFWAKHWIHSVNKINMGFALMDLPV